VRNGTLWAEVAISMENRALTLKREGGKTAENVFH
jgi:hypothetical protein